VNRMYWLRTDLSYILAVALGLALADLIVR
jgi:hypothetical protein